MSLVKSISTSPVTLRRSSRRKSNLGVFFAFPALKHKQGLEMLSVPYPHLVFFGRNYDSSEALLAAKQGERGEKCFCKRFTVSLVTNCEASWQFVCDCYVNVTIVRTVCQINQVHGQHC